MHSWLTGTVNRKQAGFGLWVGWSLPTPGWKARENPVPGLSTIFSVSCILWHLFPEPKGTLTQ